MKNLVLTLVLALTWHLPPWHKRRSSATSIASKLMLLLPERKDRRSQDAGLRQDLG